MSEKPVYIAGYGFSDEHPPSRWKGWLALIVFLLICISLLAYFLGSRTKSIESCLLRVESQPAGAEIWLDLQATARFTPAEIQVAADQALLVQVKLPGMQAEPLAWNLSSEELQQGHYTCQFRLSELEAPYEVQPDPEPLQADKGPSQSASPEQDELTDQGKTLKQPLEKRPKAVIPGRQPAPEPLKDPEALTSDTNELDFRNWDEEFRLRVDGAEASLETKLRPGPHHVQVDLDGWMLLDTLLLKSGHHKLELPANSAFVEIQIQPLEAELVAGERTLGRGRCLIPRELLPIDLRFPALAGKLSPPRLHVSRDAQLIMRLQHESPIHLAWSPVKTEGLLLARSGYVLPDKGFVPDEERGPRLDGSRYLLGRAFHDRRPGGVHSLRFHFELPESCHPGWPAELKLHAGDSRERFPLTLKRRATLDVLLNGVAVSRDMEFDDEQEERSWRVASLLRPGLNELELRNTEDARSRTQVFSVELILE